MSVRSDRELIAEIDQLRIAVARGQREARAREEQLEIYAADLRESFKRERAQAEQLRRSYKATVRALSNAVEKRDAYTGEHAERVTAYGIEVARVVGLSVEEQPELEFGFLLHDIGKVAVSDSILHKPEPLSDTERAVMEQHPVIGEQIIAGIEFLADAVAVVRHHHERWDGTGYPDKLRGEDIPLAARVFSVADVLDALTTNRPYRPASPLAEARAMIVAEAGRHFDPQVIDAFAAIPDETFERIAAFHS